MALTTYLLSGFALATTLSQTLMDSLETLLWFIAIHQVLFRDRPPPKRTFKIIISASLAFIAIQSLGLIHSHADYASIASAISEWRWIFSALIAVSFLSSFSSKEMQRLRLVLLIGLTLITTTSIIKYFIVEWGIQRADGWIGCMPLAHNLILWLGWVAFDFKLNQPPPPTAQHSNKAITHNDASCPNQVLQLDILQLFKSCWLHMILIMLMGWLLILSETRGAWIGFVASLLTLGWHYAKKHRWVTLTLVMVSILLTSQLPIIKERISQIDIQKDASTRTRLYFWEGYWELFKEHPFFGAGYQLHKYLYFEKLPPEKQNYILQADPALKTAHAHNQPLYILSGLGIVGFILYYSLILSPFALYFLPDKWLLKFGLPIEGRSKYQQYAPPLLAALVGFHIASLTEASLSIAKNRSLYIFMLAALWTLYLRPQAWLKDTDAHC